MKSLKYTAVVLGIFLLVAWKPPIISVSDFNGYVKFIYADSSYSVYRPDQVVRIEKDSRWDDVASFHFADESNRGAVVEKVELDTLGAPSVPDIDSLVSWFTLTFTYP